MKKITSIIVMVTFMMFNSYYIIPSSAAEGVIQKISSEDNARTLANNAGGYYSKGKDIPVLSSKEIALPVLEKDSGEVLGYIVAESNNLISALNAAGYTQVADALAAAEAGTVGGLAVGASISAGTIALGTAIAAGVIALALGASGGGGGGGGTSSSTNH